MRRQKLRLKNKNISNTNFVKKIKSKSTSYKNSPNISKKLIENSAQKNIKHMLRMIKMIVSICQFNVFSIIKTAISLQIALIMRKKRD